MDEILVIIYQYLTFWSGKNNYLQRDKKIAANEINTGKSL